MGLDEQVEFLNPPGNGDFRRLVAQVFRLVYSPAVLRRWLITQRSRVRRGIRPSRTLAIAPRRKRSRCVTETLREHARSKVRLAQSMVEEMRKNQRKNS